MSALDPARVPLSLYVHVPWCVRKCPYCDFNSHPLAGEVPEAEFLAALEADLEVEAERVGGRPVDTIFFGGGTPSLLSGEALARLLEAIRQRLPLAPNAEVTLEANPGTFEAARFAAYAAAGVNRLSLGVQSFDDAALRRLGRIHDGAQARAALAAAVRTFARVNVDLMIDLPGQSPAAALADVETALAGGATHLSCYQLTIEPNTPFAAAPPTLPADEEMAAIEEAVENRLTRAGFVHYEVSAWALPGEACRHNLNYWRFGDYLGVGPGAHGKLSTPEGIVRRMKHKHPRRYLAARAPFVQEESRVAPEALPFEFLMNALRLRAGVPREWFAARTGLSLEALAPRWTRLEAQGLVEPLAWRIAPTERGWRLLNTLLEEFLP